MFLDIAVSGVSVIKGNPKIDPELFVSELALIDKGPYELNRIQKISAIGFLRALLDAGISLDKDNKEKIAIFLGNTYSAEGFKAEFSKIYKDSIPNLVSPSVFTFTTANSITGWLGVQFGIKDKNLTFTNGCISGSQAILAGCDILISGKADIAVAGGISLFCEDIKDELCESGFQQELAGFLILENRQKAVDAGRKPCLLIKGFQQGFLSDSDINDLNRGELPVELDDCCMKFGYRGKKGILVHLGNSIDGKNFLKCNKIKNQDRNEQVNILNDSIGNAFSAAGIIGVSYVDKEVFLDIDSYGAYAGIATNAE